MRFPRNISWLVALLAAAGLFAGCRGGGFRDKVVDWRTVKEAPPVEKAYAENIHQPYTELGMTTPLADVSGLPARVPCLTCHNTVQPRPDYTYATRLRAFHTGIELEHGSLTCRTCHNPPRFDDFHLATGERVDYDHVMNLCRQCHSQQLKDYEHGAHGGMNGYWDRSRGPRDRNHCLDCHNAHRPKIQPMMPQPPPRYRFTDPPEADHE